MRERKAEKLNCGKLKQAPGKVRVRLQRSCSPKGGTACREASAVKAEKARGNAA